MRIYIDFIGFEGYILMLYMDLVYLREALFTSETRGEGRGTCMEDYGF